MDTLVTVIDIRNDVSKIREEIRGQVLSVSLIWTQPTEQECLQLRRPNPGQQPSLSKNSVPYSYI